MTWMIKTSKVEKWCQNVSWLLWCAYITNQCGAFRDADAEKVFLDDAQMRSWVRNFKWQLWNSNPTLKYLCQSFTVSLFPCCLDIWSIFRNTILLMLVVKRLKPAKARVWFTKNVSSLRSKSSLLKHYSSPISPACHFLLCVFATKTTPRWAVFAAYLT